MMVHDGNIVCLEVSYRAWVASPISDDPNACGKSAQ